MQLRFDGKFGFPGGFVDPGETVLEAVNREMFEEMNIDPKLVTITKEDFLASSIHEKKDDKFGKNYDKIKGFTFAKQIDEITFNKIEESSRKAEHFGTEVSLSLLSRDISISILHHFTEFRNCSSPSTFMERGRRISKILAKCIRW